MLALGRSTRRAGLLFNTGGLGSRPPSGSRFQKASIRVPSAYSSRYSCATGMNPPGLHRRAPARRYRCNWRSRSSTRHEFDELEQRRSRLTSMWPHRSSPNGCGPQRRKAPLWSARFMTSPTRASLTCPPGSNPLDDDARRSRMRACAGGSRVSACCWRSPCGLRQRLGYPPFGSIPGQPRMACHRTRLVSCVRRATAICGWRPTTASPVSTAYASRSSARPKPRALRAADSSRCGSRARAIFGREPSTAACRGIATAASRPSARRTD